jgi:hypothetical protein
MISYFDPHPGNGPRERMTARWTGREWGIRPFTTSDNNYDHSPPCIDPDGARRVLAPTESGPLPDNPGGDMVLWLLRDQGRNWTKTRQLTHDSARNHTYARRPLRAHPDFYAWRADGDARRPSVSHLHFTDKNGTHVWRLPREMETETAKPER